MFLFFIDGIGLGQDSGDNVVCNLFSGTTGGVRIAASDIPVFFMDGVMIPTDACLGVPGLPQSATGQTTIFTGVNAAKYLGYHLVAIPNEKLVSLIEEKSLMKVLGSRGVRVTSANLYSKEFFKRRGSKRRNKFPVSTLTIKASGVPFRCAEDYKEGKAVFADITNRLIQERGYDIDLITPEQAGENLLRILDETSFVFFEYFMTDTYGHKRNREKLQESIDLLSRFLSTVWEVMGPSGDTLLVVSDHGNAEDLSISEHTRNKVPTIIFTRDENVKENAAARIRSLSDIYPWVLDFFHGGTLFGGGKK